LTADSSPEFSVGGAMTEPGAVIPIPGVPNLREGAPVQLVDLPSAHENHRRCFAGLADAANRPALFHCTTGTDRTGWTAATLLMVLGVSDDDVMRDYLLTNEELMPVMQKVLDQFAAAGGDPELLLPVVGVEADYLDAALNEMRSQYGTVEGSLADALGIGGAGQQALRDVFVET
jgi:protein-tyrosine phosphatase